MQLVAEKSNHQKKNSIVGNTGFFQPLNKSADIKYGKTIQRKCPIGECEEEKEKIQIPKRESGHFFQPKLVVSSPNDKYEQEADRIAEEVLHMPEKRNQIKDKNNSCDGKTISPIMQNVLKSSGQPLDNETRNFMESRLGYNFGNIRVHNDSIAHHSAEGVNSLAYTYRNHIVFNKTQYQPHTHEGKLLLAHELVHAIRNNNSEKVAMKRFKKLPQDETEKVQTFPVEPIIAPTNEEIDQNLAPMADNINVQIQEWTYQGIRNLDIGINNAAHSFRNWFENRSDTPSRLNVRAFNLTLAQSLATYIGAIIGACIKGTGAGISAIAVSIITGLTRQGRFHLAQGYDPKADARKVVGILEQRIINFSDSIKNLYKDYGVQIKTKSPGIWRRIGLALIQNPPVLKDAQDILYNETMVPHPDKSYTEMILSKLIYYYLDWEMQYKIGQSLFFLSGRQYAYIFSAEAQEEIRKGFREQAKKETKEVLQLK